MTFIPSAARLCASIDRTNRNRHCPILQPNSSFPFNRTLQIQQSVPARVDSMQYSPSEAEMSLEEQPMRSDLSREDNVKTGSGSDSAAENPISERTFSHHVASPLSLTRN